MDSIIIFSYKWKIKAVIQLKRKLHSDSLNRAFRGWFFRSLGLPLAAASEGLMSRSAAVPATVAAALPAPLPSATHTPAAGHSETQKGTQFKALNMCTDVKQILKIKIIT